jgi:uncharacterized protein YdaU (DUF1376 family)
MIKEKKSAGPWYPRYIQDYRSKTKRLSLVEHGAYNLLLDEYYSTGEPLPIDWVQLHRICSALAPPEQAAVQEVMLRYFRQTADGWVHDRVEVELKKSKYISEVRRKAREERERKKAANAGSNAPANEGADVNTTTTTTNNKRTVDERREPSASEIDLFAMGTMLAKIVGWHDDPNWMGNYSRLGAWLEQGWDFQRDILPTFKEVMAKLARGRYERPRSLAYFEQACADAYARRMAPVPAGNVVAGPGGKTTFAGKMMNAAAQAAARIENETKEHADDE